LRVVNKSRLRKFKTKNFEQSIKQHIAENPRKLKFKDKNIKNNKNIKKNNKKK
jgi:hypothetical protein